MCDKASSISSNSSSLPSSGEKKRFGTTRLPISAELEDEEEAMQLDEQQEDDVAGSSTQPSVVYCQSSDSPLEDLTPSTYPSPSSEPSDLQMSMEEAIGSGSGHHQLACVNLPQIHSWIDTLKSWDSALLRRFALDRMLDELSAEDIRYLRDNIEPRFQKDFIACLPYEIAILILRKLELSDLISCAAVSSRWQAVSEDEFIWKRRCDELGITLTDPSYRVSLGWEKSAVSPGVKITAHLGYSQLAEHREIKKHRRYGSVYARAPYKSLIMRRHAVLSNWRRGPIRGSCVLKGHEDHVITCLQIHGDMLVTGSDDNTLRVWSIEKGRLNFVLAGHTGGVWTSQISDDGKYIVSGSTDRSVKVWNATDGSLLYTLSGHTSTVRCMALSGNILVSGSRDQTLRVWNIETGICRHILAGHAAAVRCVQFDGRTAVSGAYDFTVKVWDVTTGICKQTLHGHTNRVYSLLFDSPRNLVVSGSLDTTIRVWDIVRGVSLCNLTGHTSLTSGMQLRGNILVSCNADGNVRVWDIQKGTCIYVLNGVSGHRAAITSLQFVHDGLVATSSDDGTVKLWDVNRGEFVRDLISMSSGTRGGCIWRLRATDDLLACTIGSRNGTEDTKVILLDFDSVYP